MDRLAFNAAAAITEQRLGRQSVINELTNVSTVGFKRSYESATQAIKVTGGAPAARAPSVAAPAVLRKSRRLR